MSSERLLEEVPLFDLTPVESGMSVWLPTAGEPWPGGSWTANTSEFPKEDEGFTRQLLSEILLRIEPDEFCWLSKEACRSIESRLAIRPKNNTSLLISVLKEQAAGGMEVN